MSWWNAVASDMVARILAQVQEIKQVSVASSEAIADDSVLRFPAVFVCFDGWSQDTTSEFYNAVMAPSGYARYRVLLYGVAGKQDTDPGFLMQELMDKIRGSGARPCLMSYTPPNARGGPWPLELESEEAVEPFAHHTSGGGLKIRARYMIRQRIEQAIA